MKKILSMMLALSLILTLTACGASKPAETQPAETQPAETTAPAVQAPASALEVMESVWSLYGDEEKFSTIGGSIANYVDNAPGNFPLDDESLTYSLLIPEDQVANVTEIASLSHAMNVNSFNGAAYRLAEGVTAETFAAVMKDAVVNNQWMCGFPETLLVADIAGAYVVVVYGVSDLVEPFSAHLTEAYPEANVLINEPLM